MSLPVVPTCDVCGRQRQISNHWWLVRLTPHSFDLYPWDDKKAVGKKHLCGRACVLKLAEQFMNGSSTPNPAPATEHAAA